MKGKIYIVLLVIALSAFFSGVRADAFRLFNFTGRKASVVLSIEKVKCSPILKPLFSKNLQWKAEKVVRVQMAYIEKSPLADCYRKQPILFGILALFASVSLGALGFIFYLIRDDPRFF